jgi:serine/threonine protein kinase
MAHWLSRQRCRPQAGQRFTVNGEDYQLEGHLGDGAAGIVRKARRVHDNVMRAVKFLAPDSKYIDEAVFDDVAARFRREGQRAPFLDHGALVKIYAYVENEDGQAFQARNPKNPFILMQAVRGRTLEDHIRKLARPSGGEG